MMNNPPDTPLMDICLVALAGMCLTILVGHTFQLITGTLPTHEVWAERVIYDGEFEKHVELVKFTVEDDI